MNDETKEWIEKAEGDFTGAQVLLQERRARTADLACFASEQCGEKYLKAFLVERNVRYPKTHDLEKDILPLCRDVDEEFKVLTTHLRTLDPYGVEFRYPGQNANFEDARKAFEAAEAVRHFVRLKLNLESQQELL
jgi:HEPN domain-containing protein